MFNLLEHSWCSIVEPLRNTLICSLEFGLSFGKPRKNGLSITNKVLQNV